MIVSGPLASSATANHHCGALRTTQQRFTAIDPATADGPFVLSAQLPAKAQRCFWQAVALGSEAPVILL